MRHGQSVFWLRNWERTLSRVKRTSHHTLTGTRITNMHAYTTIPRSPTARIAYFAPASGGNIAAGRKRRSNPQIVIGPTERKIAIFRAHSRRPRRPTDVMTPSKLKHTGRTPYAKRRALTMPESGFP